MKKIMYPVLFGFLFFFSAWAGAEGFVRLEEEGGVYFLVSSEDGGVVFASPDRITPPVSALDAGGRPWAAWTAECGTHEAVFVSGKINCGWTPPVKLSAVKPYPAILPEFHFSDDALLFLSWLGYNGERYVVRSAFFAGGEWHAEEFVPLGPGEGVSASRALDMNKYVGFGDSVTAGGRRVPWDGDGYKSALQGLLRKRLNPSARVVLRGVGGEKTDRGVNRIDSVLREENPGYILIMEGINDLQARLAYSSILFNLQEMVRKSRAYGAVPVVGILPPRADSHAWQSYTEEFNDDYLRPYLREENILQADHWKFFNDKPDWRDYLDPGDQHPNPAGYDLLGEAWFVAVEPDEPPAGFTGWRDSGDIVLAWELDNSEYGHEGYNVYRSFTEVEGFERLNSEVIRVHFYVDEAPERDYLVYAVAAVDRCGNESGFSELLVIDNTSGGMCFVASASFGTSLAVEVKTLSRFRDAFLIRHKPGEAFVSAYYALGRAPAGFIRKHPLTAAAVRLHLRPLVTAASLFVN